MWGRSAAKAGALGILVLCLSALPGTGIAPILPVAGVSSAMSSPDAAVIATSAAGTTRLGAQPFVTLFCQFPDLPPDEPLRAYYEALLGATESGMADYWREVSYGQINLDGSRVTGWHPMPQPSTAYALRQVDQALLDRLATDCMAAADADVVFPDYTGINLVFNSCLDTAYGGRRRLAFDGQEKIYGVTWLSMGKFAWHATVAHEMGHAFGLVHSSDGSDEVYSNPWDVMSVCHGPRVHPRFGLIAQHPMAYHKDQLGWIPAERKYIAAPDSTAQITLERLAQPQTEHYLMAQTPFGDGSGRFYTVEARQRIGYDRSLPADGVVIHRVDPAQDPAAVVMINLAQEGVLVNSAWRPGTVFTDAAQGIRVAVESATGTGYIVTITTGPAR